MAAQIVHNTVLAGENDDDAKSFDVNTWLDQNRLKKFKPYFEEEEIMLDDLLQYSDKDLELILNINHVVNFIDG